MFYEIHSRLRKWHIFKWKIKQRIILKLEKQALEKSPADEMAQHLLND